MFHTLFDRNNAASTWNHLHAFQKPRHVRSHDSVTPGPVPFHFPWPPLDGTRAITKTLAHAFPTEEAQGYNYLEGCSTVASPPGQNTAHAWASCTDTRRLVDTYCLCRGRGGVIRIHGHCTMVPHFNSGMMFFIQAAPLGGSGTVIFLVEGCSTLNVKNLLAQGPKVHQKQCRKRHQNLFLGLSAPPLWHDQGCITLLVVSSFSSQGAVFVSVYDN